MTHILDGKQTTRGAVGPPEEYTDAQMEFVEKFCELKEFEKSNTLPEGLSKEEIDIALQNNLKYGPH